MTPLGLPVPEGFVVSTTACREYLADGHSPVRLSGEITAAIAQLEERTARRFGDVTAPLLVSVRSGARRSMPGMMDKVLNVGLVDDVVPGLVRRGGERFAWDCYRRLVHMYGHTVLGLDEAVFEDRLGEARRESGHETRLSWTPPPCGVLPASSVDSSSSMPGRTFPRTLAYSWTEP